MKLVCLFLAICAAAVAAVDLDKPVAELRLKDGRVLKNVTIVSYATSAITARWDGGRGTIAYDQLPDDVRSAAEKLQPKPTPKPTVSIKEGTEKEGRTITGQIFVTTQGAGAYKYSGVLVRAYPISFYQTAKRRAQNAMPTYIKNFGRSQASLAKVEAWTAAMKIAPTPVGYATTDADGRFTMKVSSGGLFLYAWANRSIGREQDADIWAVPVTSDVVQLSDLNSEP